MKIIKKAGNIIFGTIGLTTLIVAFDNAIREEQDGSIVRKQTSYEKYVKRPLDFFCASSALVLLSPIMTATAFLVRVDLGSPIIFKQERIGKMKNHL